MTLTKNAMSLVAAIGCVALAANYELLTRVSAARSQGGATEARTKFSHLLPQMDGSHLNVQIIEVTYPPGGFSTPHSHPCPVIVYVLEGELRAQVKGAREATYKAGESFYEPPNGVHQVSANASNKKAVRFLAYFICDHEAPLSAPVPTTEAPGGREP